MLANADTSLLSPGLALRLDPYTAAHVPSYHRWMSRADLLHATGSEPLSAAAEAASCEAWRADAGKLTFIIVAPEAGRMLGDVNVVFDVGGEEGFVAEVDVMLAVNEFRRRGIATEAVCAAMGYAVFELRRDVEAFVAKVKTDNGASLGMFQRMGFVEVRRIPAFEEIHLMWKTDRAFLKAKWVTWIVQKYTELTPCVL